MEFLLDYDFKIWGNSWEKASSKIQEKWQKRAAIGDDFSKVCASSKINLNFIRKQNIPAHNMRTFEIPAAGGFMLSNQAAEQSEILSDKMIASFSSPIEMREKIKFYLANDSKRILMAENAHNLVIQNHTYSQRAEFIESVLENSI